MLLEDPPTQCNVLCTSALDPREMGVRISREVMGTCKMDLFPSLELPPAASTTKASGAHSKRRRNFAGAEGLIGLMKSPPPCTAVIVCIFSH